MNEGIHVKVAKCNFASRWPALECSMRVGEDSSLITEEVIKEVILYVGACEGLAISVFDGNLLLARYLCTVRR